MKVIHGSDASFNADSLKEANKLQEENNALKVEIQTITARASRLDAELQSNVTHNNVLDSDNKNLATSIVDLENTVKALKSELEAEKAKG